MSEYQYVAFRAIDRPVSKENLKFMQGQSSRAKITPWSFTNEYHYGDFHGNALEMLRRGYDLYLHYANYGIRRLLIRLPHGFPNHAAAKPYLIDPSLEFVKDKTGDGGTLAIEPMDESGNLEQLWNVQEWIERLVPLRAEILSGDLRPLYLANLAVSCDSNHDPEKTVEAPVPAGLSDPTDAQLALAELYGISRALISSTAENMPAAPPEVDPRARYVEWLRRQSETVKNNWLADLMTDANSPIHGELLTEFRKVNRTQIWPAIASKRTIAQLQAAAEKIQQAMSKKATAAAARNRANKLAKMADDPASYLHQVEQHIAERTIESYGKASKLLADLRESLADGDQAKMADMEARKLHNKNPKLHLLTAALRRDGFLPKQLKKARKGP